MDKISIAIVDDEALIVALLADFLGEQENIDILFTAESGEEFLEKLSSQTNMPDIVVSDLKMKEIDGSELTVKLKSDYPEIQIIIMSSHYKRSFMGFMLKTGVSAFIPKGIVPKKLLEVIVEVSKKGFFFLPDQLEIIREQVSSKSPKPVLDNHNSISERELEVLRLICLQKTAKEIAEELYIAPRTVEGHKNTLFIKTGAKNIAGLVIYAIQKNFVKVEDIPLI